MIWHSSNIEDVKKELGVNTETGLSSAEIAGKIAQFGENTRTAPDDKNIVKKVLNIFWRWLFKFEEIIMFNIL